MQWAKDNPAKRAGYEAKRRAAKAGVLLTVKVESDVCGVCQRPLDGDVSIGHEPPLAVARREGWSIVCERPEHLGCNVSKRDRLDTELARWP